MLHPAERALLRLFDQFVFPIPELDAPPELDEAARHDLQLAMFDALERMRERCPVDFRTLIALLHRHDRATGVPP